jgi:hypothetical protein
MVWHAHISPFIDGAATGSAREVRDGRISSVSVQVLEVVVETRAEAPTLLVPTRNSRPVPSKSPPVPTEEWLAVEGVSIAAKAFLCSPNALSLTSTNCSNYMDSAASATTNNPGPIPPASCDEETFQARVQARLLRERRRQGSIRLALGRRLTHRTNFEDLVLKLGMNHAWGQSRTHLAEVGLGFLFFVAAFVGGSYLRSSIDYFGFEKKSLIIRPPASQVLQFHVRL